MFINLSNHPSAKWPAAQLEDASKYGEVVDLPFPLIDPKGDVDYIEKLADEYVEKILALSLNEPPTVHVMGELNFTYAVVKRLLEKNILTLASTTQRDVVETEDGQKTSRFTYVRFRRYK